MDSSIPDFVAAIPFFIITYGTLLIFGAMLHAVTAARGQAKFSIPALLRPLPSDLPIAEGAVAPTLPILALCLAMFFICKEFIDYIVHYWCHKVPFLWELHKVHHSALNLIPFTSQRGNPVEIFLTDNMRSIMAALPLSLICYVVEIDIVVFLGYSALFNKFATLLTLDPLRDSHLPINFPVLDRIFISPHMHQIHHSKLKHHWDKNFATSLSVFDWLFGTAYRPAKGEVLAFGVSADHEDAQFSTLKGAFVTPVVSMLRVLAGQPAGPSPPLLAEPGEDLRQHGLAADTGNRWLTADRFPRCHRDRLWEVCVPCC